MNIDQIKTLEEQANDFIENISLIQQELSNKVSARNQFENETKKIVKSLTEVSKEFNSIKSLFDTISESNMIYLFSEIEKTNEQLKLVGPSVDKHVSRNLSQFTDLHLRLEKTSQDLNQHFINYSREINDLTTALENQKQNTVSNIKSIKNDFITYNETINEKLSNIKTNTSNQLEEIINKLNQNEQSNLILSEKIDLMMKQFSENVNQQQNSNEKMNWIVDLLNDNIKSQKQSFDKTNQLHDWLNTNGEILISNSRAGIFGRKK